jgi:RNA polymerase sigma-70 factor (ECF subfamily)
LASAHDSPHTEELLRRISRGDSAALEQLLLLERDYLRRLVDLRMEDDLRRRVDPSDVVQETLVVVSRKVQDFLDRRPTSFRLWIRRKAIERLIELRRKHRAAKRSVGRELRLSDASSMAVARCFLGESPSQVADRRELAHRARAAIQTLNEVDREVLLLRHVEELSNAEVADLLEIAPDTASKRYGRAIRRLSEVMNKLEH